MTPRTSAPRPVTFSRLWPLVALGAFAPLLAASAPARAEEEPPLNTMCPVMPDEPVDPKITVVYRGKKIAFCCDNCLETFNADPEPYLAELPQFRGEAGVPSDTPTAAERAAQPAGAPGAPTGADRNDTNDDDDDAPAAAPRRPLFGRLHPALVHFPIAAAPLALFGLLIWIITRRDTFARADVPPLFLGAAIAVAAFFSGKNAASSKRFSTRMSEIVEQHEQISTIVMILLVVLVAYRLWRWNRLAGAWRWTYALALLAATALLGLTGYLGGSLVFGPDHLRF